MRITINYESSWRNSFLDDLDGNNKPLPKGGRNYIASSKKLKEGNGKNFIQREVTKNTVLGILNRLIGRQQKLHQILSGNNDYFADINDKILYEDVEKDLVETQEMIYLRNISGSNDPKSFVGSINIKHPLFSSNYSPQLWGTLALNLGEVFDFILSDKPSLVILNNTDPFYITDKIDSLKPVRVSKVDKVKLERSCAYLQQNKVLNEKLKKLFPKMRKTFSDGEYIKNDMVQTKALYCSALYLQFIYLSEIHDLSKVSLKGVSVNNFTVKNFKELFTGGLKKVYGNPYIHESFVKGEGKTRNLMTKASGSLEIIIDVTKDRAKEIRGMIHDAGVSSFYLGKKGLAYVEEISIREVKK